MWAGITGVSGYMSIVLVWRTDVHFSNKTPISRMDDWEETIYRKLHEVSEIAREVRAVGVLDGGDFFHYKSPFRTQHKQIFEITKIHQNYPCPIFGNVGNHDCIYGDYNYLYQQPLGVLFETGVFQRLYDEHEHTFVDPVEGIKVRVVGIPYHGVNYDMGRFHAVKKGDEDYLVVMAHVLASPTGQTSMFGSEDILPYQKVDEFEGDVYLFGHWHKNQGITQRENGKWIVNIGSLSRGSLSQDNIERIPACAILEFTKAGIQIKERPLSVDPASAVFNIKGRIREKAQESAVDEFVENMDRIMGYGDVTTTVMDLIQASPVPESVKQRAILIWEKSLF